MLQILVTNIHNKIAKTLEQSALKLTEEKNLFTALQPILNSDQQARWNPENILETTACD